MKAKLGTLTMHSGAVFRRHLLSGAAWLLVIRSITMLSGVAISVLLARLLQPDELGVYFLAFSIAVIAAAAARLGLDVVVIRLTSESFGMEKPGRARDAVLLTIRYTAAGSAVVAGLLYFGIGDWIVHRKFASVQVSHFAAFAALWAVVLSFQGTFAAIFRGLHEPGFAAVFNGFVAALLTLALFTMLLFFGGRSNLDEVLLLTVAAGAVSGCMAGAALLPKLAYLRGPGHLERRVAVTMAWPLLLTALVNAVLLRADIWILAMFRPAEEVAIYGAAARLINLVAMPAVALGMFVSPLIARLYAQGEKKQLERVMRFSATVSAAPSFLVLVVIMLEGEWILRVMFGDHYAAGAVVLTILSAGQLINAWAGSCVQLLMMTGCEKPLLAFYTAAAAAAFVLSLMTAEHFGMIGVAVSFATSVALLNVVVVLYGVQKLGIRTYVGALKV